MGASVRGTCYRGHVLHSAGHPLCSPPPSGSSSFLVHQALPPPGANCPAELLSPGCWRDLRVHGSWWVGHSLWTEWGNPASILKVFSCNLVSKFLLRA